MDKPTCHGCRHLRAEVRQLEEENRRLRERVDHYETGIRRLIEEVSHHDTGAAAGVRGDT